MSWLSKGLHKAERAISAAIPHAHSAQRRAEMAAAKEQIGYYQSQKESLQKEEARVSDQKMAEHKKINEKQIRSLRRTFRSPGFLDAPDSSTSEQLG